MGMSTDQHTLFQKLSPFFSYNKARLKVLCCLIIGVIRAKDVNLVALAFYQGSNASDQSQYRKLQRFFKQWKFDWKEQAKFTLSRIKKPRKGYSLAMDRTNWKFGKTHINILTIGIVIGKVSMPLLWTTLPQTTKRGNSNAKQRIALMNKVLQVLPSKAIYCLTIDREFNGFQWLKWLEEKEVPYVLRLRKNTYVDGKAAKEFNSTRRAKNYKPKEVFGLDLYFACKSIKKGRADYLYIVSNKLTPFEALEAYKERWSIEVFFGHLKKKGFNLENTHLSEKLKIDKLVAILALSFLFTIGFGLLVREKRRLNAHQKRKSVFRLALDSLGSMLANPNKNKGLYALFNEWVTGETEPSIFVV